MLMQNTPIKIFDDSLSAVDMETDAKIRDAIQTSVRGTTILIAHRITTLMNADCIAVMDHGKIGAAGQPQDLIKEGRHFTAAFMRLRAWEKRPPPCNFFERREAL